MARYVEGYTKAVAAGKYISKKTKKVINEVPGALRAEQLSVSACEDRSRELKAITPSHLKTPRSPPKPHRRCEACLALPKNPRRLALD